jgi:hypothetical protein
MKVPRFDIFSGTDKNAQWIEAVEGLDAACRRMEFHATKFPGKYFVFNCSEHTIACNRNLVDLNTPKFSPLPAATTDRAATKCGPQIQGITN